MNAKKFMFSVILILVKLLILEGLSGLAILYLHHKKNIEYRPVIKTNLSDAQRAKVRMIIEGETKYIAHSPKLGWFIKPGGGKDLYQANSQGLRADRDYSLTPGSQIRVAAFGDSFVHCDEVANNETWPEYLDNLDPAIESLNFGVSGYGLDQAYLRYLQDGRPFKPDIVLIGFMTENPTRNMSIFRPFYLPQTMLPLAKPRFRLEGDKLVLVENPLDDVSDYENLLENESEVRRSMSRLDCFYLYQYGEHPLDFFLTVRLFKILKSIYLKPRNRIFNDYEYNPDSEIFVISMGIIEKFAESVRQDGAIPIVVFLPNSGDFWRLSEHDSKNYQPFMDVMDKKGIPYFDFTAELLEEMFEDEDLSTFYSPQFHFSGKGNRFVAKHIYQRLKDGGYLEEARRRRPAPR